MSSEELRVNIRATPFRPFMLNVADGRRIAALGRDFILLSPNGRTVHVYQADGSYEVVDMLLVTGISFDPPPAVAPADGNQPANA